MNLATRDTDVCRVLWLMLKNKSSIKASDMLPVIGHVIAEVPEEAL